MSSPLGQLFDHGLDTINSSFIIFNTCIVFDLFKYRIYMLALLATIFIGFQLMQLQEYFKGELSTSIYGIGVVEMQLLVAVLYMIKSFTKINLVLVRLFGYLLFDILFYPILAVFVVFGMTKVY